IFTAKPNGNVDYLNPQWHEYTGLKLENMNDAGWTQVIHPDDLAENLRLWHRSIDTAEPFQSEYRCRRADGVYRWHLSRAHALTHSNGLVLMWVGWSTDIDDIKRAEEELQEADRRKNEFLALLGHELRNPLAPIRNAMEIQHLKDPADPELKWAREVIERQVQQLTRLVDDLLDVSRISQGKITLQLEQLDIATVVARALVISRPLIDDREHDLQVSLPEQVLRVKGDLTRLAQVVSNLLNNAAKYTPEHGRIWLSAAAEGSEVVVRVRDNGIGIQAEMLARV